jgi:Per os infectivity factor 3
MLSFNNIISIILILVILIIVYLACYNVVLYLNNLDEHEIEQAIFNPMEFVYEQNGTVDCVNTRIPCVSNRQCLDNCATQNTVGQIVCSNGFCANQNSQIAGRPDDFECDSALGLIKVFVASEFVVNQLCVSTYREIVDDLGSARPYLCDNGTLNIDLAVRQFTIHDCICSDGYTRMLFNQTALARAVPVCIPNSAANIYSKIYQNV